MTMAWEPDCSPTSSSVRLHIIYDRPIVECKYVNKQSEHNVLKMPRPFPGGGMNNYILFAKVALFKIQVH